MRRKQDMSLRRMNPPQKRYVIRVAISMLAYMGTLVLAITLVRDGHMSGPLAWILAALPGLAVTGVFWAIGRLLIEETDEYQRMLLVRQSLVASAFALSIASGGLPNASR